MSLRASIALACALHAHRLVGHDILRLPTRMTLRDVDVVVTLDPLDAASLLPGILD